MRDELIIKNINKHNKEIIETLLSRRHFPDYISIKQEFSKNGVSEKFKKSFCRFYILNGARGLNPSQKTAFFSLLYKKENDLEKTLLTLHKIPGYGNRQKIHLSFASKLVHTLDDNLPIFDKSVSSILCLPNPVYCIPFENRIEIIDTYIDVYIGLKRRFGLLLKNKEIKKILKKKRDYFRSKSYWQDDLITDTKLLDSILWALFKVLVKNLKS